MPISKYPRHGQRIAPFSLREILNLPVPQHLCATALSEIPNEGTLTLADLDENAWSLFPEEVCNRLAVAVINRVRERAGTLPIEIRTRHLPVLPEGTTLGDLEIGVRSQNCVKRLIETGAVATVRDLSSLTIARILKATHFGVTSLVDLLTSLESFKLCTGAESSTPDFDPRMYGRNVGEVSSDTEVESMLWRWLEEFSGVVPKRIRALHLPKPLPDCGGLDDLELQYRTKNSLRNGGFSEDLRGWAEVTIGDLLKIKGFGKLCLLDLLTALAKQRTGAAPKDGHQSIGLDHDLLDVIKSAQPKRSARMRERNTRVLARYLGWDGRGGAVLQTVGDEFGMSRQRVLQICEPIIKKIRRDMPSLPALDATISFVANLSPGVADKIENELVEAGLMSMRFRLEGVRSASELLERGVPFTVESRGRTRFVLPIGAGQWTKAIVRIARKSVSRWGVTTTEDVAAQLERKSGFTIPSDFVIQVLVDRDDFFWLDESRGWFSLHSVPRNRLLNQIEKIVAVAGRIQVSELRGGLSRFHRLQGFAPPRRVLLELCRCVPMYRVEDDTIIADPPLDFLSVLGQNEQIMVRVLRAEGPVLRTTEFEEHCLSAGMNRATFWQYLQYSPIIERYATGVYGLRGAEVAPGVAESEVLRRRLNRVLRDYGWTKDGRIRLSYRLSKGLAGNGVPSIPAAMKGFIKGEFQIKTPDGTRFGKFVSGESGAWGLGPLFRRRGAEPDDFLLLILDLNRREAIAYLGDESVLEDPSAMQEATTAADS